MDFSLRTFGRISRSNRILLAAWFALFVTVSGCGEPHPKTWPVKGRVIFPDGRPVRYGTVEFDSTAQQTTARGAIDQNGNFELSTFSDNDGAVEGENRAIVVQLMVFDMPVQHAHDHGDLVSPDFASFESSGLKFTVQPNDENNFTIVVRQKEKPDASTPDGS